MPRSPIRSFGTLPQTNIANQQLYAGYSLTRLINRTVAATIMAVAALINYLRDLRPSIVIAAILVLFLTFWSAVSTWRQYWRLRQFKGPTLAGFSKWWLIKRVGGGRAYLDFWEVTQKYGMSHIVLLGVAQTNRLLEAQSLVSDQTIS